MLNYEFTTADPVHAAIANDEFEKLEKLLDTEKESLNALHSKYRITPLAVACELGKEKAVDILLKRGASVELGGLRLRRCVLDHARNFPNIIEKVLPLTRTIVGRYTYDAKQPPKEIAKIAMLSYGLAEYYLRMDKREIAENYFNKAENLAQKVLNNKEISSSLKCRKAFYFLLADKIKEAEKIFLDACNDYWQMEERYFFALAVCEAMEVFSSKIGEIPARLFTSLVCNQTTDVIKKFFDLILNISSSCIEKIPVSQLSGILQFFYLVIASTRQLTGQEGSAIEFFKQYKKVQEKLDKLSDAGIAIQGAMSEINKRPGEIELANKVIDKFCAFVELCKTYNDRSMLKQTRGIIQAINKCFTIKQTYKETGVMLGLYARLVNAVLFLEDKPCLVSLANHLTTFGNHYRGSWDKKRLKPTLWPLLLKLYDLQIKCYGFVSQSQGYEAHKKELQTVVSNFIRLLNAAVDSHHKGILNADDAEIFKGSELEIIDCLTECIKVGCMDFLDARDKLNLHRAFSMLYKRTLQYDLCFRHHIQRLIYAEQLNDERELNTTAMGLISILNSQGELTQYVKKIPEIGDMEALMNLLNKLVNQLKESRYRENENLRALKINYFIELTSNLAVYYKGEGYYRNAICYYLMYLRLSTMANEVAEKEINSLIVIDYLQKLSQFLLPEQVEEFTIYFRDIWHAFTELKMFVNLPRLLNCFFSLYEITNNTELLYQFTKELFSERNRIYSAMYTLTEAHTIFEQLSRLTTYLRKQQGGQNHLKLIVDLLTMSEQFAQTQDIQLAPDDIYERATTELEVARWYQNQNNLERAASFYDDAFDSFEEAGVEKEKAQLVKEAIRVNEQLGQQYAIAGQYKRSIEAFLNAIEYCDIAKDPMTSIDLVKQISQTRSSLAEYYIKNNKLERAEEQYQVAIETLIELEHSDQAIVEIIQNLQTQLDNIHLKSDKSRLNFGTEFKEPIPSDELNKPKAEPKNKISKAEDKAKVNTAIKPSNQPPRKAANKSVVTSQHLTTPSFFKPGMLLGKPMHGKFLKEEASTIQPVLDENASAIKKLRKYNPGLYKDFKYIVREGIIGRKGFKYMSNLGLWEARASGRSRVVGKTIEDENGSFLLIDDFKRTGFHR